MDLSTKLTLEPRNTEPPCRVVIRLRTQIWTDHQGIHIKRDINYLRRRCKGHNFLEEDVTNIGTDVLSSLPALDAMPDGIYEVNIINERTDWETGYIDDYDYSLTPVKETPVAS